MKQLGGILHDKIYELNHKLIVMKGSMMGYNISKEKVEYQSQIKILKWVCDEIGEPFKYGQHCLHIDD